MAKHKLTFDDFYSDDFVLIAIHSTIPSFRLAFFLNKQLPILLVNTKEDISISTKQGEGQFSWFKYEDENLEQTWNLVSNRTQIENNKKHGLFFDDATTVLLLPELPKIDFLLKIENTENEFNTNVILSEIRKINQVTMCYKININELKNSNNLIF